MTMLLLAGTQTLEGAPVSSVAGYMPTWLTGMGLAALVEERKCEQRANDLHKTKIHPSGLGCSAHRTCQLDPR